MLTHGIIFIAALVMFITILKKFTDSIIPLCTVIIFIVMLDKNVPYFTWFDNEYIFSHNTYLHNPMVTFITTNLLLFTLLIGVNIFLIIVINYIKLTLHRSPKYITFVTRAKTTPIVQSVMRNKYHIWFIFSAAVVVGITLSYLKNT